MLAAYRLSGVLKNILTYRTYTINRYTIDKERFIESHVTKMISANAKQVG